MDSDRSHPADSGQAAVGTTRIRVSKEGYAPFDGTVLGVAMTFALDPVATVPEGMIHVPGGTTSIDGVSGTFSDFWMDRFEISNKQFKAFVDAGGYKSREYWKEPFVEDGRPVTWEQALTQFRDATGRPGPSTWELGTFPQGQADHPVSASAGMRRRRLPSLPGSPCRRRSSGALPPGSLDRADCSARFCSTATLYAGLSPDRHLPRDRAVGTYDMAGNVKEWCWNESRGGRMILGGGWNEPTYMYEDRDAQPPINRQPTYGFRLVKNREPQPAESLAYLPPYARDYSIEKPIDDAAYSWRETSIATILGRSTRASSDLRMRRTGAGRP